MASGSGIQFDIHVRPPALKKLGTDEQPRAVWEISPSDYPNNVRLVYEIVVYGLVFTMTEFHTGKAGSAYMQTDAIARVMVRETQTSSPVDATSLFLGASHHD